MASWAKEAVLTANQEESWAVQLLASNLEIILNLCYNKYVQQLFYFSQINAPNSSKSYLYIRNYYFFYIFYGIININKI